MAIAGEVMRGYKYPLDVRPDSPTAALLGQYAGQARRAYNMAYFALKEHSALRDKVIAEIQERDDCTLEEAKLRAKSVFKSEPERLSFTLREALRPESTITALEAPMNGANDTTLKKGLNDAITSLRARDKALADQGLDNAGWHIPNRHAQVSGIRAYFTARKNWFDSITGKRAGSIEPPTVKRRGRSKDSFRLFNVRENPFDLVDEASGQRNYRRITLPTISKAVGTVRLGASARELGRKIAKGHARILGVTLSRHGTRWYISFQVEERMTVRVKPSRAQQARGAVGVDLGVNTYMALSTGEFVANPRNSKVKRARITRTQRNLSRATKFSVRWFDLKRRLGNQQHSLALTRAGFLHRTTTRLAQDFSLIGLEDLNVKGMTATAKGTVERPGKKVKQKSGLNREILDVSFGASRTLLEYKTKLYGSSLVAIDRFAPSSKKCSRCGTVKNKLGRGVRIYRCDICGFTADRDTNAAVNIRQLALDKVSPSGVQGESKRALGARGNKNLTALVDTRSPTVAKALVVKPTDEQSSALPF